MAKRKELFLIGTDKLRSYDIADDPNKTESSSDIIALTVSNTTTNEFYYDEDFAIPFDANLTDGQVAPLEDSLLLYSTPGGHSASQRLDDDATTLSPYRTVIDLSDSEIEMNESVRRVNSCSDSEVGNETYWGTDSRILRGCGRILVESVRSSEDFSGSSDSLAQEMDCDKPEVRLTTWAEVGSVSMRSSNWKPEADDTCSIKTSSSSEELDQYESNHLVTWARLENKIFYDSAVLKDESKSARESVDDLQAGFMPHAGSQLSLATGLTSSNTSMVDKNSKCLNGSMHVSMAAGMTTWRTLMTSNCHDENSSSSGDTRSTEEWTNHDEPESPTSHEREKSISSPSSKDDGYDSVSRDLSINDSIQDSAESQSQFAYHRFEAFASCGDNVESTLFELPEILRLALQDSSLQDSRLQDSSLQDSRLQDSHLQDSSLQNSRLQDSRLCSTADDDPRGATPYCLLDDSLVSHRTVEDQKLSDASADPLFQGRGVQDENDMERWDSLNLSSSSSCRKFAYLQGSRFKETSTTRWSLGADAMLSLSHERKGQQLQEAHTLPRFSKRKGSMRSEAATNSFVYQSLMRPLPDLGFLRRSTRSDRDDKQNLRICSEIKTESVDASRKQVVLNSESTRQQQNILERDSVGCSLGTKSLSETGNGGNSSLVCTTLGRTRSRNSDSTFSAHSSTSSGIDLGTVDLDDGYGTWNPRKLISKAQNVLGEPWNSVAQKMPEPRWKLNSCKESGLPDGESPDIDPRTERLVVKVCNTCNVRTVHLREEKQTSRRSTPLFADCKTNNLLASSSPKIIVSNADNTNYKSYAFDTVDPNENLRSGNSVFATGSSNNNDNMGDTCMSLDPVSHSEDTGTPNIAFDTVKSWEHCRYDSRKPHQRDEEGNLVSEDRIQTNSWSNVADSCGKAVLVNYDKSHIDIDNKDWRQQLTNIRDEELDANILSPKTVYVEFNQEKDNAVKGMESQGKRGKEIQMKRGNKKVSILENGVRFRPGSIKSETASPCAVSKAIRIASASQQGLQRVALTAGAWNPAACSHHEVDPFDDQPPVDFLISPDTDSSHESRPSTLTQKTDLLLNTMRSVETLLHHFNRNRTLKGQSGSTQSDDQVGHLVLDHLCPALLAILSDGLKPELQGLFGTVPNSVRQVIENSATLGRPPSLVRDLVASLKRLTFLNTPCLFFNAFIFALLNCKALDFWLSYIHSHASLLDRHYAPASFLRFSHPSVNRTFQDLISFLQPLALVPFRLEYNFEARILEGRLGEYRRRRALERHLVMTNACPGIVEIQQNFSNDRLLGHSRILPGVRSSSGKEELSSDLSDKLQQYTSAGVNTELGSSWRPLFTLNMQREDDNEVGSSKRFPQTPRSSVEVVGARVIPPVEIRPEPHAVAINHGTKYTPDYRNYQRYSDILSPLCPDKQINFKKQDNRVPCRALTLHSNVASRSLWSDYRECIGLVRNRLEKLVFGSN